MTIWEKLTKSQVPVLIIHGSDDEIIPVAMGRRLFAAANSPKDLYIIPGAHHNDTYVVGGKAYFERLKTLHFPGERNSCLGRPIGRGGIETRP